MKKLLGYLPFHFLLCLILGICVQFYMHFWNYSKMYLLIFLMIIIGLLIVLKKNKIFIALTWIVFFFLGITITYLSDNRNNDGYYEKHALTNITKILVIKRVLKSTAFYEKYEAKVIQVDSQVTKGLVLLNIKKDSTIPYLQVDDKILTLSEFSNVKTPLNPHQFDYRSYLAKKGIHQQVFLESSQYVALEREKSFLGFIANVRSTIQQSLKKQGFSKDTYAVMNALLLGQRQDISKELSEDYARAGAIHILAVSGLHVGILLLVLSSLFKPLERLSKGKILKAIFIVLFLWFFALLAGMSASVVRAVTMFSAVAVGQVMNQKNSVERSLIFSMFVLLLCKPLFLFDVGFQLSYIAVFGIVLIQPKLEVLWNPKWRLVYKIWQLLTVSVAAQLAVLPLSLYYFHQFPGLFMLSNLVIVPFLGIILIGGILIVILSLVNQLPEVFVRTYDVIISLMNDFIRLISDQETFLFTDISFSGLRMLVSYGLIVSGFYFFMKLRANRLLLLLSCIIVFQFVVFFEKYQSETKNEFVVFHKSRSNLLGKRHGNRLEVVGMIDSTVIKKERALQNYKIGEKVALRFQSNQRNYIPYLDHQILIIDSLGVYELTEMTNPIVILKDSPKINLERLIETLQPSQIIADGSNYTSYINHWEMTCIQTKTPFWSTSQNGAYILKE